MTFAYFQFFGELNDFLPRHCRERALPYPVDDAPAVKHPIEALGVPHPEVEAIVIAGEPVAFCRRVQGGELVQVYPAQTPLNGAATVLRPPLPRPVRFLLDTHLGQLAAYLRMLGVDAAYSNAAHDHELAAQASAENRVLLTRDRGLLKRKQVVYGYCVRTTEPRSQLIAVLRRYNLAGEFALWRRCLRCNGMLVPVDKGEIEERLEPRTRLYYDAFQQCSACGRIYWQGSHHARMAGFIDDVLAEAGHITAPTDIT